MPGLFQGLELGRRALLTHQLVLQTSSHNIANVNTPGFSRQRVEFSATQPEYISVGSIGTGVSAYDVLHVRDLFLGAQYRQDNKSLGQWTYKEKTMSQVESLFGEPNDQKLSDLLNDFWNSWENLATTSNQGDSRAAVLSQANGLINGLNELAGQLLKLQDSTDGDLVNMTTEVNRLTAEVARLNFQIKRAELGSQRANDLRDQRDYLIDKLSSIVDVNTVTRDGGVVQVYIGGMTLVDEEVSMPIETEIYNDNGRIRHAHVWKGTSFEVVNLNGQMKGLIDSRDEIIPKYLAELDLIAKTLVEKVNEIHVTGYGLDNTTGNNFFDPNYVTAATIRISGEILNDPMKIAAAAEPLDVGGESDNRIALALADLRNQKTMRNNSTSINDYYGGLVGTLGVEANEAASFTENYDLLVQHIEEARQAVQGVSLDEEMTNLVKYQHAYDAAARVITSMDEALDTVIKGMGVVGRL